MVNMYFSDIIKSIYYCDKFVNLFFFNWNNQLITISLIHSITNISKRKIQILKRTISKGDKSRQRTLFECHAADHTWCPCGGHQRV